MTKFSEEAMNTNEVLLKEESRHWGMMGGFLESEQTEGEVVYSLRTR